MEKIDKQHIHPRKQRPVAKEHVSRLTQDMNMIVQDLEASHPVQGAVL